jgi:hypothetical protein
VVIKPLIFDRDRSILQRLRDLCDRDKLFVLGSDATEYDVLSGFWIFVGCKNLRDTAGGVIDEVVRIRKTLRVLIEKIGEVARSPTQWRSAKS